MASKLQSWDPNLGILSQKIPLKGYGSSPSTSWKKEGSAIECPDKTEKVQDRIGKDTTIFKE